MTRALPTIFSFFLGLMLAAFLGIGVNTFHPPPTRFTEPQQALDRRIRSVERAGPVAEQRSAADRAVLDSLLAERDRVANAERAARADWARSTSIILITLATLVMGISLVRAEQLQVVSNGLLLGGVFTMLYGTGWIIAAEGSTARFAVITVAFAITVALGYLRFARARAVAGAEHAGDTAPTGDLARLERRVRALEQRLRDAAGALGTVDER